MKKYISYLIATILIFIIGIFLVSYSSYRKSNVSLSANNYNSKKVEEEVIIIDNTDSKSNNSVSESNNNVTKNDSKTDKTKESTSITNNNSDKTNKVNTDNTSSNSNKVNNDDATNNSDNKKENTSNDANISSNSKKSNTNANSSEKVSSSNNTKSSNNNTSSNSKSSNNTSTKVNTYTDKINGDRCYVDGNTKVIYYITECESASSSSAKCKYSKKNGVASEGTVTRNKLKLDLSMCSVSKTNTYTDKINGDRCYVDGNTKTLYYITECESASSSSAKCKYSKKNGVASEGTVLRNKLRYDTSTCSVSENKPKTTTYTDKINGDRCYVDGNTKVIYYITECESASNSSAKCKYSKKNGVASEGTVLRNKLRYDTSTCSASNNKLSDGNIIGSTGFSTSSKLSLKESPSNNSKSIMSLEAGYPFKILGTNSNDTWWKVSYKGQIGYVDNAYMMINLPDYIPSIQYNMMNANNNIYTASGVKLSIYGKKLYKTGKVYNARLERDEYIVPAVYSFAKKILNAQIAANKEGYGLKIYDSYRPKSVADELRDSLASLYYNNSTVRNGINYSYENGKRVTWGQGWFIAQNLSAHSVGAAIDVVLVDKNTGKEIPAQSSIHDLSTSSVKYSTPVSGQTTVRNDLYSNKANKHTRDLDRIMVGVGMTNLASEWWHFQDNDTYRRIKSLEPSGLNFQPTSVVSSK